MSFEISVSICGFTELGQGIERWDIRSSPPLSETCLILGAVHGNEFEGVEMINFLIQYLYSIKNLKKLKSNICIIPILNKDGYVLGTRANSNDVDLNRNVPSSNWSSSYSNPKYKPGNFAGSEKETVAFMDVIASIAPSAIVSCHSYSESLILCSKSVDRFLNEIKEMAIKLDIPVKASMDYTVTGSLNSYGNELDLPVVTIEAPRGDAWDRRKEVFKVEFVEFISKLTISE